MHEHATEQRGRLGMSGHLVADAERVTKQRA
jgi:hypothetical protein